MALSEGLSKCVTTGSCYLTVVNPSLPPGVKYKLIDAWFIYLGKRLLKYPKRHVDCSAWNIVQCKTSQRVEWLVSTCDFSDIPRVGT